jgi:hypothetical protein
MSSTGRSLCAFFLATFISVSSSGAQQPAAQGTSRLSPSGKFVLDDGTPVRLRLNRNLSSVSIFEHLLNAAGNPRVLLGKLVRALVKSRKSRIKTRGM